MRVPFLTPGSANKKTGSPTLGQHSTFEHKKTVFKRYFGDALGISQTSTLYSTLEYKITTFSVVFNSATVTDEVQLHPVGV